MLCPHCGSENADHLKYCIKCGEKLDSGKAAAAGPKASGAAKEAADEAEARLSRADRKSAKARRAAKAKAAKRAGERPSVKADQAEMDEAAARARKRARARRAAAVGAGAGEAVGEEDRESLAATELTGRGVRTRRATQETGSVGDGGRTLETLAAEQRGGEGYRPAVSTYSRKEPEKKSRKGLVAGLVAAALLAGGGGYYALNGNPFAAQTAGDDANPPVTAEPSGTSEGSGSDATTPQAEAAKPDFENDTFRVELPDRWKDKLTFTESEGVVVVKDKESGTLIAQLLAGDAKPDEVAGQTYGLGTAKVDDKDVPVSLFVADVDADGKTVEVGQTGEKSALDHYLDTTAKVFSSYLKIKDGDDFGDVKFESASTGNSGTSSSADGKDADGKDAEGEGASSGSGSGGSGSGGAGGSEGSTWSGGAGSTIEQGSGVQSSSGDGASQPAPEPTPAPEPAPAATSGGPSPFWGAWIGSFKSRANAEDCVAQARAKGYDAQMYVSNEWTGLNQDLWYKVTVGTYGDKASAQAAVQQAKKSGYRDAYIEYTGDHK